jgi:hypothetical protein
MNIQLMMIGKYYYKLEKKEDRDRIAASETRGTKGARDCMKMSGGHITDCVSTCSSHSAGPEPVMTMRSCRPGTSGDFTIDKSLSRCSKGTNTKNETVKKQKEKRPDLRVVGLLRCVLKHNARVDAVRPRVAKGRGYVHVEGV